jgi:hypothetical protein
MSCAFSLGALNSLLSLVSFLDEDGQPQVREYFIRGCVTLRLAGDHFPMVTSLMRGIKALVSSLNKHMPEPALWCFADADLLTDVSDIPMSYFVPQHEELRELFATRGDGIQEMIRLGALIEKWHGLTIT